MRMMASKAEKVYESVKSSKNLPEDLMRQLKLINQVGTPKDLKHIMMTNKVLKIMTKIYSSARVLMKVKGKTKKLQLNKGLLPIMNNVKKERLKLLEWAWKAWRDAVGKKVRHFFVKLVHLANKGAKDRGYKDYGVFTRSCYDMDPEKFKNKMAAMFSKVEPLYKKLHAFVRFRLREILGNDVVDEKGMIPAHLLGMWPSHWQHLYKLLVPFQKKKIPDVTKKMREKGIGKMQMLKLAEKFFLSLGMKKLPKTFWKKSLLSKKGNKKLPCQASALDVGQGDVRMKMPCLGPSQESLVTVHHEMGHIQYYLSYLEQPYVFRVAANQGFQESIGDTVALSITTPKYLHDLGLIPQHHDDQEESINYLMKQALQKISFLPYAYMIEIWRWDVFSRKIPATKYNQHWWMLRNKYQGVKAPVKRTEEDFDPGAFFHIDKNVEYIPYFFSQILQYMTQKALCKTAGHKGELHTCSIYKSKKAGKQLSSMLSMGRSKPWQEILKETIGQSDLDPNALLEYYKPLETWLDKHRKQHGYTLGWEISSNIKQG
ncbi:angiotensin-converting enzyme-like isoform X2 [Rhopilema esculentum]